MNTAQSASSPSANGPTHASRLCGSGAQAPNAGQERTAARNASLLPNLRANAQLVAPDLPDPAAVGYLLLLFDQCRDYDLTHEELVSVFGRPLLAFLDLALQAVEKLAARSGIGKGAGDPEEAPRCSGRWLTPYQLARLRDIAGEYVGALPDGRALEALLLIYDLLEIFALSPGQCETVFGTEALRGLTELVYGDRRREREEEERANDAETSEPIGEKSGEERCEKPQHNPGAPAAPQTPHVHLAGRSIPIVGTVGEGGRVTYAPEARLWLRYIGAPGMGPIAADAPGAGSANSTNGGAA